MIRLTPKGVRALEWLLSIACLVGCVWALHHAIITDPSWRW